MRIECTIGSKACKMWRQEMDLRMTDIALATWDSIEMIFPQSTGIGYPPSTRRACVSTMPSLTKTLHGLCEASLELLVHLRRYTTTNISSYHLTLSILGFPSE